MIHQFFFWSAKVLDREIILYHQDYLYRKSPGVTDRYSKIFYHQVVKIHCNSPIYDPYLVQVEIMNNHETVVPGNAEDVFH